MTIDRWILDAAARSPGKAAIIFEDEVMDYASMASRIDAKTRELMQAGVQHGDRVAYLGLNHPDIFVLLFSCARIGAILVPLNWRLAVPEIAAIVSDCTPKLCIHSEEFAVQAKALGCANTVAQGELIPSIQHEARSGSQFKATTQDPVLIVYTSGSTGVPKGVVLTQQALICNAAMSVHAHGMREEDIVLNVLPLFHVGGLNILPTPAFSVGATVRLHATFDPDTACRGLTCSSLAIVVPTVLEAIMQTECWNAADLGGLRGISIGSTDVPVSLIEAVHARNIPVIQIYGATETSPFAIYQTLETAFDTVGSIGRKGQRCDVRLVSAGRDVAVGEPGEIWVRGENVLKEYWRNAELTNAHLSDGWWRSGDVATCDQDGNFWFTDRIKNVIISGGENIYPTEIERILREIPGIREVSVVGRKDQKWGEVPVAVIVAEKNIAKEDVLQPLENRLARYKHPKDVVFVENLPRNATGKILVEKVRALV